MCVSVFLCLTKKIVLTVLIKIEDTFLINHFQLTGNDVIVSTTNLHQTAVWTLNLISDIKQVVVNTDTYGGLTVCFMIR